MADSTFRHEHEDCSSHVTKIMQACQWVGIVRGRADEYAKLIQELFDWIGRAIQGRSFISSPSLHL